MKVLLVDKSSRSGALLTDRLKFWTSEAMPASRDDFDIAGVSLDLIVQQHRFLVGVDKKELNEALELQLQAELGQEIDRTPLCIDKQIFENGGAYHTMILKHERDLPSVKTYPLPMALLGLAEQRGLLDDEKDQLFVLCADDKVYALAVRGRKPVNFSEFDNDESCIIKLRMTTRTLFLSRKEEMMTLDRIQLLAGMDNQTEAITKAFGVEVNPCEYGVTSEGMSSERALLALGLVQLHRSKVAAAWRFKLKQDQVLKKVKRGLAMSSPAWLIFLYLWYASDVSELRSQIQGIQGRRQSLAHKHDQVSKVSKEVTNMTTYMQEHGSHLTTPMSWHEFFASLDESRPLGVRIDSLSGVAAGKVTINGTSPDDTKLTRYMKHLSTSKTMSGVTLVSARQEKQGLRFQLLVHMGEAE